MVCFLLPLFRVSALGILFSITANSLASPQQPASTTAATAPIPTQILNAKTVFISNAGGDALYNSLVNGGPDRAYNQFYQDAKHWGRYQLAPAPTGADLIFEISAIAPVSSVDVTNGTGNTTYATQLRLRIIDPTTHAALWTLTSNLNSLIGTKKTRDKKFDAGVVNLLNQLRQLDGEQLTPQETAAIHRSYGMSTAAKVFIVVGIVALAASIAVGIHMATSHPTLTQPTLPGCQPPFCPATRVP
jgi:hypothetical protein